MTDPVSPPPPPAAPPAPPPPPAAPPPPPAPAPAPAAEPPAFLAGLDDAARAHIEKNGYKTDTPENLIQHLVTADMAAVSKLGRPQDQLLVKPSGDFAENKDSYMAAARAMGMPEEKSGYGEAPAMDGLEFRDGVWDKMTDLFLENGVMTWQVPGVLQGVAELVKGQQAEAKTPAQLAQEGTDALVGEVGQAKAEAILADSKALLEMKGDADLVKELEETGLGNNPRVAKFLAKVMADYKESGLAGDRDGQDGGKPLMTPAQAQAKIEELERDPQFTKQLMNKTDPGHAQAVARRSQLYALANPETKPAA